MPEAVYAGTLTSSDFVTRDAFNIHVGSVRERLESEEKLNDARMERFEALMSQNLMEQKMLFNDIKGEIKLMNNHINTMEKRLNKLDTKVETLQEDVSELRGDVKTLSARLDAVQWKTGLYVALLGVVLTFVITAVQFWK